MKSNKISLSGILFSIFILFNNYAIAGTGGARDGQVLLLVILAVLTLIFGILYFSPLLLHWIREQWKKYHHC